MTLSSASTTACSIASLWRPWRRWPKRMREVVVLRDVYDLTHEDIARELEISVTAAKVRLHRARKRLRELVAEVDDTQPDSGNASTTEMVRIKDVKDDGEHHAM